MAQSLFFVGTTIGALICGPLCDFYGRQLIFVSSTALCGASTAVELFAPNYILWTSGRVLAGVTAMSSNISANIYRTEVLTLFLIV